jgi:hypothetical protein
LQPAQGAARADDALGVDGILDGHRRAVQWPFVRPPASIASASPASRSARSKQVSTTAFNRTFTAVSRAIEARTASVAETFFSRMSAASLVAETNRKVGRRLPGPRLAKEPFHPLPAIGPHQPRSDFTRLLQKGGRASVVRAPASASRVAHVLAACWTSAVGSSIPLLA